MNELKTLRHECIPSSGIEYQNNSHLQPVEATRPLSEFDKEVANPISNFKYLICTR